MNQRQAPQASTPSRPPAAGDGFPAEPQDFSLVLGGPLYQLLVRSHLATPALELITRRIVFISLIAWLPLLFLALADGKAWGGGLPFLYDFEMQARFLLLFFAPCLMRAKRIGLREYGMLASRCVRDFDRKWVRGGASAEEPLLGSGDLQSLADLGNSFQVIREIKPFPFGKDTVIQLVVLTLIPVLPLVLTMIPLEELTTKLVGAVF
ncbi:MAG: hypothetical protein WC708_10130 [Lentisphaeria bacterium]